ncbi:hypothetical protein Tco_0644465 [Tanacetum coccineum]
MSTLKFADTHNMVAFLSKPTESDGFEQIVDFLNAHPIRCGPGAKKPWGILLLKRGLRMHLNFLMIHCSQEGRIDDIDTDENITLVNVHDDVDDEMFDVNDLGGEEVLLQVKMKKKKKRSREEVGPRELSKKAKGEDDKETAELKQFMEVIPDEEEVAINAIPLAVKSLKIMLKSLDMEDLEDLYKLMKSKYESTRPVEDLDLLL